MPVENHSLLISVDALLEEKMCILNGQKVLPDDELSKFLHVSITQLTSKVRANADRFPVDFAFVISNVQYRTLFKKDAYKRSGIYVFTLAGIMQAAGLFKTKRAVDITIQLINYIAGRVDVFKMLKKS